MAQAVFDQTTVDIEAKHYIFRATGQVIKFDGFIRAYTEGTDEKPEDEIEGVLPELIVGEGLQLHELLPLQHFTEPPARYTDATLVKALEAHGVGRPSTYAPTLSTIQDRGYVEKEDKKYKPTEEGFLVNDMLVENFPEIVDINFTSHIEEELDDIAEQANITTLAKMTAASRVLEPWRIQRKLDMQIITKLPRDKCPISLSCSASSV
jgi:DNA topoisomerase-1